MGRSSRIVARSKPSSPVEVSGVAVAGPRAEKQTWLALEFTEGAHAHCDGKAALADVSGILH